FNLSPAKTQALIGIIQNNKSNNAEVNALVLAGLDSKTIQRSPVAKAALDNVLKSVYGTQTYIDLVKRYELKSETPRLLQLALDKPEEDIATEAVRILIGFKQNSTINNIVKGNDHSKAIKMLTALSKVAYKESMDIYRDVISAKGYADTVKSTAAFMVGRSWAGEDLAMKLVQENKITPQLETPLLAGLEFGPRRSMLMKIQDQINGSKGIVKAPFNKDSVMALKGNKENGYLVWKTNCSICHQVKGEGTDFGPKLTEIGSKLPKDGLLEAIMNPSAGVSFGYETTELQMKDGSKRVGLLASKTEQDITLKLPGGTTDKIMMSDIKTMKQTNESMMPALHEAMSKQELADLLEYLSSLQKK
ncbi:MAG: c-type cytochrome, partial [Chitinophagaceae bacterium]|nr:c-type cytochrome [Chitinophagaceae bacterium]